VTLAVAHEQRSKVKPRHAQKALNFPQRAKRAPKQVLGEDNVHLRAATDESEKDEMHVFESQNSTHQQTAPNHAESFK
jgi:hypothetical protein